MRQDEGTNSNVAKLVKIKKQIEIAENKLNRMKGEEVVYLRQLEEGYSCVDLEEASKLLREMKKEIDRKSKKFDLEVDKLVKAYDWDI